MIGFSFDKTLQSTAYFLKRKPGARDNYMRVLKLLYIADRTSLAQRAAPISGDTPYAMPRGPVFSRTLNLMKGSDPQAPQWGAYIARDGYEISLIHEPGNMQLSKAEIDILGSVWEKFRNYDEWAMVKWCHKHLPEYEKNWKLRGESRRRRIPFADVLVEVGRAGEAQAITTKINEAAYFRKLFGDHEPQFEGLE